MIWQEESIPAVRNFSLKRYLGRWYEIARLPHRFERGMSCVRADYAEAADSLVAIENSGVRNGKFHSISGKARPKGDETVGELMVNFFGPFEGEYRIIRLDPAYTRAVVAGAGRKYLWFLAREPYLKLDELEELREFALTNGFDIDELEYPPQRFCLETP